VATTDFVNPSQRGRLLRDSAQCRTPTGIHMAGEDIGPLRSDRSCPAIPRPLGRLGKPAGRAPPIGPIAPCVHQYRTFFMCSWIRLGSRSSLSLSSWQSRGSDASLRCWPFSVQTVWACRFKQCQQHECLRNLGDRTVSPTRFCHSRLSIDDTIAHWGEMGIRGILEGPFGLNSTTRFRTTGRQSLPVRYGSFPRFAFVLGILLFYPRCLDTSTLLQGPKNTTIVDLPKRSRSRQPIWPIWPHAQ
jgi:hypothetical protein